jgi:phage shock protein E
MYQQYDCEFIEAKMVEGGQLIDVRTPFEFNQGALEGAVNMPIDRFQALQDRIDRQKPVLLYCRTGARSEMVKRYLEQLGFDQVHNIGGIHQFNNC